MFRVFRPVMFSDRVYISYRATLNCPGGSAYRSYSSIVSATCSRTRLNSSIALSVQRRVAAITASSSKQVRSDRNAHIRYEWSLYGMPQCNGLLVDDPGLVALCLILGTN